MCFFFFFGGGGLGFKHFRVRVTNLVFTKSYTPPKPYGDR